MLDPALLPILHDLLQRPWRFAMGLKPLDPADWLIVTEGRDAEVGEKEQLFRNGADIHRLLPEGEEAAAEMAVRLEANLARHHPRLGVDRRIADPLVRLGLALQEDLCLMRAGPDGYRLVGAFVAFPSRWNLGEKIGRSMPQIHAPVPGLEQAIGRPVQVFFDKLAADRPVWRANWSITDDPALHQPSHAFRRTTKVVNPEDAGNRLWLRVERQTLTRLPQSRAVLFTIMTFIEPLSRIADEPDLATLLASRLDELSEEMLLYKNLAANKAAIGQYLRRAATVEAAGAS